MIGSLKGSLLKGTFSFKVFVKLEQRKERDLKGEIILEEEEEEETSQVKEDLL